jgi:hypothetical protein
MYPPPSSTALIYNQSHYPTKMSVVNLNAAVMKGYEPEIAWSVSLKASTRKLKKKIQGSQGKSTKIFCYFGYSRTTHCCTTIASGVWASQYEETNSVYAKQQVNCYWIIVAHPGMETGISEASKRVSIFSFATQGGKQVSFYFGQELRQRQELRQVGLNRLRFGSLLHDLSTKKRKARLFSRIVKNPCKARWFGAR